MRSATTRRSYTLIELLLVCAILGIAGTLLIPQIVGRDIMACQAAVRLIIGDISYAQSDALAHQEIRRVHFNDDGTGYSITRVTQAQLSNDFDAATADYIDDPLNGGRYIVSLTGDSRFPGVTIESVDIDNGSRDLHFDALAGTITHNGTPGTGGTIIVKSANEKYRITVAAFTGKLTVQKL
jgi:Tfp pilus assembly protein FimT